MEKVSFKQMYLQSDALTRFTKYEFDNNNVLCSISSFFSLKYRINGMLKMLFWLNCILRLQRP